MRKEWEKPFVKTFDSFCVSGIQIKYCFLVKFLQSYGRAHQPKVFWWGEGLVQQQVSPTWSLCRLHLQSSYPFSPRCGNNTFRKGHWCLLLLPREPFPDLSLQPPELPPPPGPDQALLNAAPARRLKRMRHVPYWPCHSPHWATGGKAGTPCCHLIPPAHRSPALQ